jgi:hypothetical protein
MKYFYICHSLKTFRNNIKTFPVEKIISFANRLNNSYCQFLEKSLNTRRFKHSDILPLIKHINGNPSYKTILAGHSIQGREIFLIKTGMGKTKVLLWSQMHGDEPTATAAIFDIFNFLSQINEFQDEIREIRDNLELIFIPMVNPDGAEVYKRRNSLDIDLNRDAARLQADETRLLKKLRDEINPEYGFNLHDQDIYYSVGPTKYPTTISFLAPSSNYEKTIDTTRIKSIKQIILMNEVLQNFIPNCIGRYNDDFMPTAFGDNMQLSGTSTILIESGGFYKDPEKQTARKMNFLSIMASLLAIATNQQIDKDIQEYFQIPENKKDKLHDLIVRNLSITNHGKEIMLDIAIRIKEINSVDFRSFETKGEIIDIGDLTYFHGYHEYDAKGLFLTDTDLKKIEALKLGMAADFCLVDKKDSLICKIVNGQIL